MPNFDCGGESCGRFSCSSCTDEATQAEYWNLLRTVKDDDEADKIMRGRLAEKRARAVKLHNGVTRLLDENEQLRAALIRMVDAVEKEGSTRQRALTDAFVHALKVLDKKKGGK